MFLAAQDLTELIAWRHERHSRPELSGQEEKTAQAVQALLHATGADKVVTGLGGHGVLGIYQGDAPGPTIMLRAELDGLPIQETSELAYRSSVPGKAHLCGHDGHMTILAAVARGLGRQRPKRGRVALLFQPAEKDGSGAAAVPQLGVTHQEPRAMGQPGLGRSSIQRVEKWMTFHGRRLRRNEETLDSVICRFGFRRASKKGLAVPRPCR